MVLTVLTQIKRPFCVPNYGYGVTLEVSRAVDARIFGSMI